MKRKPMNNRKLIRTLTVIICAVLAAALLLSSILPMFYY